MSLGVLIGAAAILDALWPVFLLLGWKRVRIEPGNTAFTPLAFDSYPISHSLLATLEWSVLGGSLYWPIPRDGRDAEIVALLVVSHGMLDALSHRPDLPLTLTGSARVGLGLWNSVPATFVVEAAMFAVGGVALRYVHPCPGSCRASGVRGICRRACVALPRQRLWAASTSLANHRVDQLGGDPFCCLASLV